MNADLRCKEVQRRLPDYLEGELPSESRSDVDAHLVDCAECASEVAEMEATIRLLRGLPEPETPPMIAANVMRRIRAGETEPTGFERVRRTLAGILEPSFVLPASAMAVAALVVVVVQGPAGPGVFGGDSAELQADAASGRSAGVAGLATTAARPSAVQPRGQLARRVAPMTVMHMEFADPDAQADPPARVLAAAPAPVSRPYAAAPARGFASSGGVGSTLAAGPAPGLLGGAGGARAIPVAGPAPTMAFDPGRGLAAAAPPRDRLSGGGVDVRDEWLAAGLRNPRELAQFLAAKSLAEQELWVGQLARRADERGLLGELVEAFESTRDDAAMVLADDFRAAVDAAVGTSSR